MKGPSFNARVSKANAISDEHLAKIVLQMRKMGSHTFDQLAMSKVLRPFLHMINLAQEENAQPAVIQSAIAMLTASMYIELAARILPKGIAASAVQSFVEMSIADVNEAIVDAFNANYGDVLQLAHPASPPLQS